MEIKNIFLPQDGGIRFADREIKADDVQSLLQAALLTIGSGGKNTCELYVTDEEALKIRLADVRDEGAECVASAPIVIAVTADRLYDGAWMENCSAAAWAIRMEAERLGLVSRCIQIRGYSLSDGTLSDEAVRGILGIPEGKTVCMLLAVGYADTETRIPSDEELDWERIHII